MVNKSGLNGHLPRRERDQDSLFVSRLTCILAPDEVIVPLARQLYAQGKKGTDICKELQHAFDQTQYSLRYAPPAGSPRSHNDTASSYSTFRKYAPSWGLVFARGSGHILK